MRFGLPGSFHNAFHNGTLRHGNCLSRHCSGNSCSLRNFDFAVRGDIALNMASHNDIIRPDRALPVSGSGQLNRAPDVTVACDRAIDLKVTAAGNLTINLAALVN